MPRGYDDYKNPPYAVAAQTVDYQALAVAILGYAPVDGRGRLLWWDKFHEGLGGWKTEKDGDGILPYIADQFADVPPSSVTLNPGTLTGKGSCTMWRPKLIGHPSRLGVQFSFQNNRDADKLYCRLGYATGGASLNAQIDFFPDTGLVYFLTDTAYNLVGTFQCAQKFPVWTTFKMVLDFATGKAVRVLVGDLQFDFEADDLFASVNLGEGVCLIEIKAEALGDLVTRAHLGHVLLTLDEP